MSAAPIIPRAFSRRTALGLGAGLSLAAAGCVSVPTTGPISPVSPSGPVVERGGGIDVRPPATDATPLLIVLGFLDAMAAGGGTDLAAARLFLLPERQESWQPVGVTIYPTSAIPAAQDDTVVLKARPVVGQLDPQSAFVQGNPVLDVDFGMVRDGSGQWRIGAPPETLLVSRALFEEFYRSYDRYFFEPTYQRLVPDPVFLPYRRGSSPLAGALVQSLLHGPTTFLADSVVNLFPAGTQLEAQSVVVTERIADVELSDQVLGLAEPQRSLLAAQLS